MYVVVAQQSSSVFDVVKRDLTEFTSTMQQDSSKVATTVKEKLTVSLALFCLLLLCVCFEHAISVS